MSRRQHEQAMTDYLEALLDEQPELDTPPASIVVDERQQQLEKLLQGVALAQLQVATPDPEQIETSAEQVDVEVVVASDTLTDVADEVVEQASSDVSEQLDSAEPADSEVSSEQDRLAVAEPDVAEQVDTELATDVASATAAATAEQPPAGDDVLAEYQENDFQALFFSVAGLTLAVPLKSLGGIHQLSKVSPLFGKPDWFMGIMTEREDQLHAVDTARWVMPEKYNEQLAEQLDYQYLIMLSDSRWGLACERLVTSEPLQPDAIQWRKSVDSRRPWLAGVVRERMCALLDVNALIKLLDQGLGAKHATKSGR